jgi:aminoglycoside phosphotransferase (APT) family kinase protein
MQAATAGFVDRYRRRLSRTEIDVLETFAPRLGSWALGRPQRWGLVHGDYRLDNLLFGGPAGGAPVSAVDWQTIGIGLPARDLAYFLGNAMAPAARRKIERDLVGTYHRALRGHGVNDYPLDECWDDYRYGLFQGPTITVLGAMGVVRTDRGDEMFMAMISRACAAIVDLDALALLP